MTKTGAVAALVLAVLVACTSSVWAVGEPKETSTRPPTNLKKVGDHWTPWNPPPAGPEAYIIQKGDCLWDLAGKWLQNPHLWPQIWDLNRYIEDSHWIYPGDPLVVPGKPTVVPPGGPPPAPPEAPAPPSGAGEQAAAPPAAPAAPAPAPLVPVADLADVYCSGWIAGERTPSQVRVIGRETERVYVAQGDVVYINQGRGQGMQAGRELAVIRQTHPVEHPVTDEVLGTFVKRLGKLRILATQENTATAVIEQSCADIVEGDEVVPWTPIPIPRISKLPPFDRWGGEPSGGQTGYVVESRDDVPAVGSGYLMYTNLGTDAGIAPGDVLTVYREQGDLPLMMLGQAVVVETQARTSSAKVMLAVKEIYIGDRVEVGK